MPSDVYVTEAHPVYFVMVDGVVYDTLVANRAVDKRYNIPLTFSQQYDIAQGYKEALDRS